MFKYSAFILAVFSSSVLMASEEDKTLEQKLAALKLERVQAEIIIKTMVRSGRLNDKEAGHAARAIASAKEEDVEVIRTELMETLNSANSLATK